jgi:uroporphyrinogen decarboxylase
MTTHRERITSAIEGAHLDRVPVALWRHFPVDDQNPNHLARAIIDFQDRYDFDLIKVTPSSSFCLRDWGAVDVWRGNPEGTREYGDRVIQSPADWHSLRWLDPHKGHLAEQLECNRILRSHYNTDTPILQTIFSPLSQAKNLAGQTSLLVHLRTNPEDLMAALEIITKSTIDFISACYDQKIDGIFYAIQHAQFGLLSREEYLQFGLRYDRILTELISQQFPINIVHLHGEHVMFSEVAKLSASILNWHDRSENPDLSVGQDQFSGAVCGGLQQWNSMVLGTPETIEQEALQAIHATQGQRFILGTGCVLPITAPHCNIMAARHIVDQLNG